MPRGQKTSLLRGRGIGVYPGQYYDQETGLHYNYHRHYDPATGRYVTPDPIGLAGGINLWPYVRGNPLRSIDPWGLLPPQNIPLGVNITQNIEEARNMSWIQFYNAVKTGGKWDYKQCGGQYEEFGNYHFGIVGAAAGRSEGALLRGAGVYQVYSDLLKYGTKNNPGWPWGSSPYGDQPQDQIWIKEGIKDYYKLYNSGGGGSW